MNRPLHSSRQKSFSDSAALALTGVVKSQLSPTGIERVRTLVADFGHRLGAITGLITVRHDRLVRPAWHITTDSGPLYVILINDIEAELYDGRTNNVIARVPAIATTRDWASATIMA